jgi:hypothetical protein
MMVVVVVMMMMMLDVHCCFFMRASASERTLNCDRTRDQGHLVAGSATHDDDPSWIRDSS